HVVAVVADVERHVAQAADAEAPAARAEALPLAPEDELEELLELHLVAQRAAGAPQGGRPAAAEVGLPARPRLPARRGAGGREEGVALEPALGLEDPLEASVAPAPPERLEGLPQAGLLEPADRRERDAVRPRAGERPDVLSSEEAGIGEEIEAD